jgi:hypothetical protein
LKGSRECLGCGARTIRISRFSTRRRGTFTCPNCGEKFEKIIPPVPYYLANLALGILASLAVPGVFLLWFSGNWLSIPAVLALLVFGNLGVQIWFSRIAVVQRPDETEPVYKRRFW